MVLVEYVPTFSRGLNFLRAHCYNTRQCTVVIAAMPLIVKLLLLREEIVRKVHKRKRADRTERQTDRHAVAAAGAAYYLLGPMPLICFFDGPKTKSEINCLQYQLTQT